MEVVKLILPVFTFVLGMLFTLYLKGKDERRQVKAKSIDEICSLSEDWYNRLHTLSILVRMSRNLEELDQKMPEYAQGSLILAKYRRSLETLRKFPDCMALVDEASRFLNRVAGPAYIQDNAGSCMALAMKCHVPKAQEEGSRSLYLIPSNFAAESEVAWWRRSADSVPNALAEVGLELTDPRILGDLYERVQRIHLKAADVGTAGFWGWGTA